MQSAIRTEELTKDYAIGFWRRRPYRALDRLTIDIEPGEVFGFLGPNGAGKTTTLKLLMQLIYPSSGRAEILGRRVGDVTVKRRIGYLAENPYFYDYLTAEEVLTYFASLFGYRDPERRQRVSSRLDQVGIGAERRMQLRKFSKGMLQRVGIAQALISGGVPRRADVGARSDRPARSPVAHPPVARQGVYRLLQLAHSGGR
jgi:ABC-2 type transport system ATP-binding protein